LHHRSLGNPFRSSSTRFCPVWCIMKQENIFTRV
jgi:hypothetical protein